HPDLVFSDDQALKVMINSGRGTFHSPHAYNVLASPKAGIYERGRLASADFNGDGFPDVIAGSYLFGFAIFFNRGDGNFKKTGILYTRGKQGLVSLDVGDFNGDHQTDIVAGCDNSSCVEIFLSQGDGSFQTPTIIGVDDGFQSGLVGVVAGDFNGDHK